MSGLLNIIVAVTSFVLSSFAGFLLIPLLTKIKFGQTIKDIGPVWHKKKQGTPTMGGFIFIIGIVLASVLGFIIYILFEKELPIDFNINMVRFFSGIILALAFGFVGFIDDYIKVVKKQNLGLKARQKTLMQIIISVAYVLTLYIAGDTSTVLVVPGIGQFDLGIMYFPLVVILIIGTVNAVNLTDGIDGLASSVTFIVGISLMVMCGILKNTTMGILSSALAAGCLGFLIWNFFPAKVFMGDTGSMFLGGALVGIVFGLQLPIILALIGFIYLIEALSVIIQIISFKLTGKRVFKMSPIHHHFEMLGWSETKIVVIFSLVTAIFCAIAIYSVTVL